MQTLESLSNDILAQITSYLDVMEVGLLCVAFNPRFYTRMTQGGAVCHMILEMDALYSHLNRRYQLSMEQHTTSKLLYVSPQPISHFCLPSSLSSFTQLKSFDLHLPFIAYPLSKLLLQKLPATLTKLRVHMPSAANILFSLDPLSIEIRPEGRYPDVWLPLATMFPRLNSLDIHVPTVTVRQKVERHLIPDFLASLPPSLTHLSAYFISDFKVEETALLPAELTSIEFFRSFALLTHPKPHLHDIEALVALGARVSALKLPSLFPTETLLSSFPNLTDLTVPGLFATQVQTLPATLTRLETKMLTSSGLNAEVFLWRSAIPSSVIHLVDLSLGTSVAHAILPPKIRSYTSCFGGQMTRPSADAYPNSLTSLSILLLQNSGFNVFGVQEEPPGAVGFHWKRAPSGLLRFSSILTYRTIDANHLAALPLLVELDIPKAECLDRILLRLPPNLSLLHINRILVTGALLTDNFDENGLLTLKNSETHVTEWIERHLSHRTTVKRVSEKPRLHTFFEPSITCIKEIELKLLETARIEVENLPKSLTTLTLTDRPTVQTLKKLPPNLTRLQFNYSTFNITEGLLDILPRSVTILANSTCNVETETILAHMHLFASAESVSFPKDFYRIYQALRPTLTLESCTFRGIASVECFTKLPSTLTALTAGNFQKISADVFFVGSQLSPRFPNLTHLNVGNSATRILPRVLKYYNLTSLAMTDAPTPTVHDISPRLLYHCPASLRSLTIRNLCSLSRFHLPENLETLIMEDCDKFSASDLMDLTRLKKLKTLVLHPLVPRNLGNYEGLLPASLERVEIEPESKEAEPSTR